MNTSSVFLAFRSGALLSDQVRPTPGNVEVVARFIDGLRAEAPCEALPFVAADEVLAAVALDLGGQPEDVPRFARYVSLTYASNAGLCGAHRRESLPRSARALAELLKAQRSAPRMSSILEPYRASHAALDDRPCCAAANVAHSRKWAAWRWRALSSSLFAASFSSA